MVNTLSYWIEKIANIGVRENIGFLEEFKLRLVNRAFSLVGTACILLTLDIIFFRPNHTPLIAIAFVILSFGSLLFNYYDYPRIGKIVLTLVFPTLFLPIMVMYGNDLKLDYTVFVFIVVVLILFQRRLYRILIISYLLLLQLAAYQLTLYFPRVFEEPVSMWSNLIILSFNTIGLLILVSKFLKASSEFQDRQRETNEHLLLRTRELQQSNEFLERYTYITSHDLKTPIRTIFSFSELLERKLKGRQEQDVQDYLNFIKMGSLQLRGIVDGIVENAESTRSNLHFETVRTDDLLDSIREKLKFRLEEVNGEIHYQDLLPVKADPKMLYKVLYNLIDNGLKYNRSDRPRIIVSITDKELAYEISVADNGFGIPEAYWTDIFKMFKKLNASKSFTGSGVGLALCKRIVDLHGGKIWLETSGETGSIFKFSLPKQPGSVQ